MSVVQNEETRERPGQWEPGRWSRDLVRGRSLRRTRSETFSVLAAAVWFEGSCASPGLQVDPVTAGWTVLFHKHLLWGIRFPASTVQPQSSPRDQGFPVVIAVTNCKPARGSRQLRTQRGKCTSSI